MARQLGRAVLVDLFSFHLNALHCRLFFMGSLFYMTWLPALRCILFIYLRSIAFCVSGQFGWPSREGLPLSSKKSECVALLFPVSAPVVLAIDWQLSHAHSLHLHFLLSRLFDMIPCIMSLHSFGSCRYQVRITQIHVHAFCAFLRILLRHLDVSHGFSGKGPGGLLAAAQNPGSGY